MKLTRRGDRALAAAVALFLLIAPGLANVIGYLLTGVSQ